jgi:hypothetical protein
MKVRSDRCYSWQSMTSGRRGRRSYFEDGAAVRGGIDLIGCG